MPKKHHQDIIKVYNESTDLASKKAERKNLDRC